MQLVAPQEQGPYHGLLEQGGVILQVCEAQRLSGEVSHIRLKEGPAPPRCVGALHHSHRLAKKRENFAHPAPREVIAPACTLIKPRFHSVQSVVGSCKELGKGREQTFAGLVRRLHQKMWSAIA